MAQFNSEGLVRLQTYMAGKTLSDSQATAVVSADVVEMPDAAESETRRRYYRIAEDDESITFSCILGLSQKQMVVTKATKQLSVTTMELGGAITPGTITTEMLADRAVTGDKIGFGTILTDNLRDESVTGSKIAVRSIQGGKIASRTIQAQNLADSAVTSEKLADGAVTSEKLADSAVTSEKLAEGLDVSGLFFILPEGTQFPYTLTEDDKAKLENVDFLVAKSQSGKVYVASPSGLTSRLSGSWYGLVDPSTIVRVLVQSGNIQEPVEIQISDPRAVLFTSQTLTGGQKTQARTNIGAAEDPNTSGDTQVMLEEPPVIDE